MICADGVRMQSDCTGKRSIVRRKTSAREMHI
jgi:hypothetical protein